VGGVARRAAFFVFSDVAFRRQPGVLNDNSDEGACVQIGDLGQPRVQNLARDLLLKSRLVGSFLFAGPMGVGKEALAIELGRLLNCKQTGGCPPRGLFRETPQGDLGDDEMCPSCRRFVRLTHPDLHVVFPVPTHYWEKEPDRIAEIYRFKSENPWYKPVVSHGDFDRPLGIAAETLRNEVLPAVQRKPVEADFKVIVLSDADLMAFGIGNLLLKTLEEPPDDCLLVLTSSVPDRLLPTIRSRCQVMNFSPLQPEWMTPRLELLHHQSAREARLAANCSQGSMLTAERFFIGQFKEIRDRAIAILKAAGNSDTLELLEMANDTARDFSKNRHLYPVLLRLMSTAARDALLLSESVPTVAPAGNGRSRSRAGTPVSGVVPLVNDDKQQDIEECASRFGSRGLQAVIRRSEEAERHIAGYAHAELALSSMFLSLARESHKARMRKR
jgi:DNA polymerase-3 subunit delta'